jgi:hypothetical protein
MLNSEAVTYLQGRNMLVRGDNDDASGRRSGASTESSIPARYQNGRGGVNLEQVRRDQRRARQELIRAMIRRLGSQRDETPRF